MSAVQIGLVITSWVFMWFAGSAHGYWAGWEAHRKAVNGTPSHPENT